MAFFKTLKRHIFSQGGRISSIFTVLRSVWDSPCNEFTTISVTRVYFFGAKIIASFSRENVAENWKTKKHRISGNFKFYIVPKFHENQNKCETVIWTMPFLPSFMPTVFRHVSTNVLAHVTVCYGVLLKYRAKWTSPGCLLLTVFALNMGHNRPQLVVAVSVYLR